MSGSNKATIYQNYLKQVPNSDLQASNSDIPNPEFTQTAYKGGEDLTVTNMYKDIVNESPQVQTVYKQQVKDAVAELNQKGYYNGMSLDPTQNNILKQNKEIYDKPYGGIVAVNNRVIPKEDQTIGGNQQQVITQQNAVQQNIQQTVQNFKPQYDAALNRQLTEQKPIDQTRAIEETNPGIYYERQMIANALNRYDQLNRYINYMNNDNVPSGDSRQHKLDPASMIKVNPVQTPGVYLTQQDQLYRPQPNQTTNLQTTVFQNPAIMNQQLLDQQQINLFSPARNNIASTNIQARPQTKLVNPTNQQMMYQQYTPNNQFNESYNLSPQLAGRTLQNQQADQLFRPYAQNEISPGGMIQNQDLLFGGGESNIFGEDFLFNR